MINKNIGCHVCFALFALFGCQHDVRSYGNGSPNDWRVIFKEFIDFNQLDKINEKDILIISRGRYSKSIDVSDDYVDYSIGSGDLRGYDISYSKRKKLDGSYVYRMDFRPRDRKNMCINIIEGKSFLGNEGLNIVNIPEPPTLDLGMKLPKDYANKIYSIDKRFGDFQVILSYRYENCLVSATINNRIAKDE